MPNIISVHMNPISLEKVFKGNQICLLHKEQQCFVGDVFFLEFSGERHYFKIIDIWLSPKEFVLKFLWRMCGTENNEELNAQLNAQLNDENMVFAHIFTQISWDEVQNLVKT